jgi:hypothetical protein
MFFEQVRTHPDDPTRIRRYLRFLDHRLRVVHAEVLIAAEELPNRGNTETARPKALPAAPDDAHRRAVRALLFEQTRFILGLIRRGMGAHPLDSRWISLGEHVLKVRELVAYVYRPTFAERVRTAYLEVIVAELAEQERKQASQADPGGMAGDRRRNGDGGTEYVRAGGTRR